MGNVLAFVWATLFRGLAESCRLGALGLLTLAVLGFGGEARAEPEVPLSELPLLDKIVCERAPGVPNDVNVWAIGQHNKLYYSRTGLYYSSIPKPIIFYVFRPDHPKCQKNTPTPKVAAHAAPPKPKADAPKKKTVDVTQVEKPKTQEAPKRQSATKRKERLPDAELAELEVRRRRALEARKNREIVLVARQTMADAELAKMRDEEAREEAKNVLPTVRHSEHPTPLITSACPGCGIVVRAPESRVAALRRCRPIEEPISAALGYVTPAGSARVRESIARELDEYKRAKTSAPKAKHGQMLRDLFTSIAPSLAQDFRAMLDTQNELAVMFRQVLKGDPLRKELLDILEKKYVCTPVVAPEPEPPPPTSSPLWLTASQGQALPPVAPTDAAAFKELDTVIGERLLALIEKGDTLHRLISLNFRKAHRDLINRLDQQWRRAKNDAKNALQETASDSRRALLKRVGDRYLALLVGTELGILRLNAAVVVEAGDEAAESVDVLGTTAAAFDANEPMIALLQAVFDSDVPAMERAYPAWNKRYEGYEAGLNKVLDALGKSAELSKKVIKVADIAMIAISIYQVAKMPVVPSSGPWTPPAILGTLPGGVALSAGTDLVRLSSTLAALQKLVQIGALDAAAIGTLSTLGGKATLALPELQRPTSLSMQASNPPGGAGNSGSGNGGPPAPSSDAGPVHHVMTNKNTVSTTSGGPWTPRFQQMAEEAGMSLEDAANKVSIPGHHGPHPQAYHTEVFDRLKEATDGLTGDAYSKAFRLQLSKIRTEAATPGTRLNLLLTGH